MSVILSGPVLWLQCNTLSIFSKHTDLNVSTCLEECSSPHETVRFPLAVLLHSFRFDHAIFQVRAAALTFATELAHVSQSQRRGKHDFSEVVKAVVQLMSKDGRLQGTAVDRKREPALQNYWPFEILFLPLLLIHVVVSAVVRVAAARVCERLGSLNL